MSLRTLAEIEGHRGLLNRQAFVNSRLLGIENTHQRATPLVCPLCRSPFTMKDVKGADGTMPIPSLICMHSRSGGVVTVDVKAAARAPGAAQRGRTSLRPHLTGEYARVLCGACFLAWKSASNTSNLRVECFIFVSLPLKMVCYWSAIAHMSLYPVSVVDSNLSGRETGAHHSADGKQITRTSTTSTNVPARRNTPTLKAGSC